MLDALLLEAAELEELDESCSELSTSDSFFSFFSSFSLAFLERLSSTLSLTVELSFNSSLRVFLFYYKIFIYLIFSYLAQRKSVISNALIFIVFLWFIFPER